MSFVLSYHNIPSVGFDGALAEILYLEPKLFTEETLLATVFTLAISEPTKFTLVILSATTSISEVASCKSLATSITFVISEPILLTFVIFVATVFMLAWFVARVPNPDIPAKVFISALSDGDNHVFSR